MARPRKSSDDAILAATARVIGRCGLGELTLSMIAQEVDLSPATLVQRFGSKRGLLLAFAARAEDGARRPFEHARQRNESPLAALHGALTGMASGVQTPEELANNLGFLQLDLTDPEFRKHAAEHTRVLREEIARLLVDAMAVGELPAETDIRRLAGAIQVAYNGTLIVSALDGEGSLVDRLRSEIGYLLDMIRCTL